MGNQWDWCIVLRYFSLLMVMHLFLYLTNRLILIVIFCFLIPTQIIPRNPSLILSCSIFSTLPVIVRISRPSHWRWDPFLSNAGCSYPKKLLLFLVWILWNHLRSKFQQKGPLGPYISSLASSTSYKITPRHHLFLLSIFTEESGLFGDGILLIQSVCIVQLYVFTLRSLGTSGWDEAS